jgi:CubicO group peptidase (beta-lactamase class C family)
MKVGRIAAAIVVAFCIVATGPSPAADPRGNAPAASETPAPSADSTAVPSVPAENTRHELTAADLEAWLNSLLTYGLKNGDMAGAVVAVVKDGKVLFQSGYGYADVEKKLPMDPERWLYRIGNVLIAAGLVGLVWTGFIGGLISFDLNY